MNAKMESLSADMRKRAAQHRQRNRHGRAAELDQFAQRVELQAATHADALRGAWRAACDCNGIQYCPRCAALDGAP